jgi:ribosomal protein S12 methylthiotransferase
VAGRYWIETLGCPKNQVDSDKLSGTLDADGLSRAAHAGEADVVVVNTCAFIEEARRESIDTILSLAGQRKRGARLVVTGCLAQRYGEDLAAALPEADLVAGFGVPVTLGRPAVPALDLLNLPRPPARSPWAYVKVAEGCDRTCGFCAIPSFRGRQRSRSPESILAEVEALGVQEVVLVAQDLASYGRDVPGLGAGSIGPLVEAVAQRAPWVRLLYLYPSELSDALVDVIAATPVHYFDLSLQHVAKPLLRRMRRWGDGTRFARRIEEIRGRLPDAAFRSNFIVGYPGETEDDHDALLRFVQEVRLDWCGFFAFSREEGTYAAGLADQVPETLVRERLAELNELQDQITADKRLELVGHDMDVLIERPGRARSGREAPEIDGTIIVAESLPVGSFARVTVTDAVGPDVEAQLAAAALAAP